MPAEKFYERSGGIFSGVNENGEKVRGGIIYATNPLVEKPENPHEISVVGGRAVLWMMVSPGPDVHDLDYPQAIPSGTVEWTGQPPLSSQSQTAAQAA